MSPLALSLRLLQAQPDGRLLALAREGHEAAFEALVRRYRGPLLAYCRRIIPEVAAEDVLQQALLQAWGALGAGVEVKDARAWLYRIVRNAAISFLRSAGEAPATLVDAVAAAGVEQLVEQRLAAREALAHLAALPELQREVMLGTALEGRSHEELARELGVSGGSVRGLIYRARTTLRAAAAALIPSPLVGWAVRSASGGRGAGGTLCDAIAGGGTVGAAGALVKGGAAVTFAGALAGAALVTTHGVAVLDRPAHAAVIGSPHRPDHDLRSRGIVVAATIDVPAGVTGAAEAPSAATPASRGRGGPRPSRTTHAGTSSTRPEVNRRSGAGKRSGRTEGGGGGFSDSGQGGTSRPDRSGGRDGGSAYGSHGSSGSDGTDGQNRNAGSGAAAASVGRDFGSHASGGSDGGIGGTVTTGTDGSSPQRWDGAQQGTSSTVWGTGGSQAGAGGQSGPQPDSSSQSGPRPGSSIPSSPQTTPTAPSAGPS